MQTPPVIHEIAEPPQGLERHLFLTELERQLLELLVIASKAWPRDIRFRVASQIRKSLDDEEERQRLAALFPIPDDEITRHYKPRRQAVADNA